ncbi:unnamed protein product [Rhodiola kirilowii]
MAGIRSQPQPDDSDNSTLTRPPAAAPDPVSDDERSLAADSWSIKSEYGSTLDDEQRHADAFDVASTRLASEYSSDKDEANNEASASVLGLQSYWDATYADELANFSEHGHVGEVWFGEDVMEIVVSWTKNLCLENSKDVMSNHVGNESAETEKNDDILQNWSVLDIGTGNGLLLQEFAKQGFTDLTGTDYVEGAVELARRLADRAGFAHIKFLVDDVLETKLDKQFQLVVDKGTLDAIGLHPDGPLKRIMYWNSVSKLVESGGILVITSCNHTKDELIQEVEDFNQTRTKGPNQEEMSNNLSVFRYLSHVTSYPTFMFGGSVGSRVATVAFIRI